MASLLELKPFQWASVKSVCDGLETRAVYALADEVGLGKTLVCAEVTNQLLATSPKGKQHVVYYIAPSIELLQQNLRSIRRYLEGRCGERFHIWTSISRLSQIPRDFAEHRRRRGGDTRKGVVHLVGLSPGTSFSLRGAGQFSERTFLAALFSYWKQDENRADIARFFWCLKDAFDLRKERERKYVQTIDGYASEEYLGPLLGFRESDAFRKLYTEILAHGGAAASQIRTKVAEVRHTVTDFLIKSMSPTFVIFDEWHKYKRTCFTNRLLERFLDQSRSSSKTKVLLVSATPFSVEFKDGSQGEGELERGGDLEGLLQMVWGKHIYQPHYRDLIDDQELYIQALTSYLKDSNGADVVLRARRDKYERHLRTYCTRTERPRADAEDDPGRRKGDWTTIVRGKAFGNFLERFRRGEHVRSPILDMWSDGHGFPSYGYPGLERHSGRDLPGVHWKVERLIGRIKETLVFEDGSHSFRYPPLWLPNEKDLKNRKHLVFTEFLFVPEEVCKQLDSRAVRFGSVAKKKWTGSVLGYFPTKWTSRSRTEESAVEAIHFVLFYPFLVFELQEPERRRTVARCRSQLEYLIATETDALTLVRRIEETLADHAEAGIDRLRLQYRWDALAIDAGIPASARFREYLRFVLFSDKNEWSLTAVLARVVGELWRSIGPLDAAERAKRIKDFERATLRLAAAVLRLFASPEAQTLKGRVPLRLPRAVQRRWNSHVRFAISYSKQFGLEEVLLDFAKLLSGGGASPEGVLDEMAAAIALRKGAVGNRYIRSFHDRKLNEAEYADDGEEAISLKSLRAAFNSPFPPYVLVSTSVGQEGLDFHRYCASVIHWSPPSSPSVLRQREGRVDRFQALQVRRVLREWSPAHGGDHEGMSPDFVLMRNGQRINHVDRDVWYLPFTSQEAAWKTCLQRMYYNDLLIGAPDPLSDERALIGAVGNVDPETRRARFRALRTYAISLKPRSLTPAQIAQHKDVWSLGFAEVRNASVRATRTASGA